MKMAEPVMLNPNSYTNVENILLNLKESADIGKSREWVFLGCGGPPYCFEERIANDNPTIFSFASFVPGLGHLHMNQMKTLFRVILNHTMLL